MEIVNYIYELVDPRDGRTRYIGKAKNPASRYDKHLKPYYLRPETHKNRWLRQLLAIGLRPILVVLCEVDASEDVNQIERDFIRWSNVNGKLTNGTPGGDGGPTIIGRRLGPRGPSPMRGVAWALDDPRRELIALRQRGQVPLQALLRARELNKRRWRLTSPEGEVHIVVGLTEFSKEHGLSASKLSAVARGEANRTQHKGWRCEKI